MRAGAILILSGVLAMPAPMWAGGRWGKVPTNDEARRPETVDVEALAALRAGRRLRVTMRDGRTIEGRFVAVEGGELVIHAPAGHIPIDTVRKVRVRGSAAKTGALAVGVTAGALMALLMGSLPAVYCEGTCGSGEGLKMGLAGLGIGGFLGAAAGGLIGAAIPEWHHVKRPSSGRRGSTALDLGDPGRFQWKPRLAARRTAFDAAPPALRLEARLIR